MRAAALALAAALTAGAAVAATINEADLPGGDHPDASSLIGGFGFEILATLLPGDNTFTGALSGFWINHFLAGALGCNHSVSFTDPLDSFAVAVPEGRRIARTVLTSTGFGPAGQPPHGYGPVLFIETPDPPYAFYVPRRAVGQTVASRADYVPGPGPARLSVITSGAAETGPFDVDWSFTMTVEPIAPSVASPVAPPVAAIPAPPAAALLLTALLALRGRRGARR